ncbi:hypothetical protein [Gloeothece verrucosa]|uniref:Uncharacterized protein n=1 Tax=Gloeothece verrucosa (strain PCC 7822) TaxID=497965 RepID=E0U9G4_GLOV7|nr:hypothetical protein [Gloeothece verrucosa]ADN12656.1 hypothetical protein Cyan7822_0620 [Gloeothece verrucosa PCC 7822]
MERVIKDLLAFIFAIVVACGFQALPAHAQIPCTVTSYEPCVLNLENHKPVNVNITQNLPLLVVYTNNNFTYPGSVTLKVGGKSQDITNLEANESVWEKYRIQNFNGVQFQASSAIGKPNLIVVVLQADRKKS